MGLDHPDFSPFLFAIPPVSQRSQNRRRVQKSERSLRGSLRERESAGVLADPQKESKTSLCETLELQPRRPATGVSRGVSGPETRF